MANHAAVQTSETWWYRLPKGGRIAIMTLGGLIAFCLVVVLVGYVVLKFTWLSDESLPDYRSAESYETSLPTTVYASDRETVLAEFQLENRDPVEIDQICDYVLKGTVATEDERFYDHGGVDIIGIFRAFFNNITGGALEGASTLTQQLVRNTILADEMNDISIKRKLREAYIAIKLEEQYSKDEILLMYLNSVNYGSGAYGIEAASQRYFSKHASDLTLAEAAALVGIPQSPTRNSPANSIENCTARRNVVLDRMLSNGYISQEEHDAASAEELVLNETIPSSDGIYAYPYFTSYVRNQLTDAEGKYAFTTADVFEGGLKVYTTLDVNMQNIAEQVASDGMERIGEPFEIAMVAIDPDNGYIKAMVGGGIPYGNGEGQTQVNMATGEGGTGRQAGSSFKTYTLVAALEAGISPETLVDAGASAELAGWKVSNIYNISYGTVPISKAFAVSSNTAFGRLCMSLGPQTVADTAHRMGIGSQLDPVGSLTLGTSAVTPLEMAEGYATIASGGIHHDAECIIEVYDRRGNLIVDNNSPEGERVLTSEVAHAATEVMKGVLTDSQGTGRAARLKNQVAAGKTGTSNDYKDMWFCGITPQLSVAIWMGDRADPVKARSLPSRLSCTSFYASFMNQVLDGQETEDFPKAGNPPYTEYRDAEYHIGNGKYSLSDEEMKEQEEEEERKKAEEEEKKRQEEEASKPQTPEKPTTPTTPVKPDPEPTTPSKPTEPTEPTTPTKPTDPTESASETSGGKTNTSSEKQASAASEKQASSASEKQAA